MSFKLNSFFNLTETQIDKIYEFQKLMIFWNERINLISRKDIDNFIINHVIHSLSISCFFNFNDNTKILDFGTGGGLPGIPLSICFPNVKFHLVDSIKKKIDVVDKISRDLNLNNVEVTWSNVKNIEKNYDFIVSRAVAKYPKIKSLCLNKFSNKNLNDKKNGFILLKGENAKAEFNKCNEHYEFSIYDRIELEYYKTKKIFYIPNPYIHKDN
jgi:16S rRNA (guanine527-N7)-methyltransferase